MLYAKDNKITLTQGNTTTIDITPVSPNGQAIILREEDKILFTVKTQLGKKMLSKVLTSEDKDRDGSTLLFLTPEDTVNMEPATYLYDCLLLTKEGEAITFISSTFTIVKAFGKYSDVR